MRTTHVASQLHWFCSNGAHVETFFFWVRQINLWQPFLSGHQTVWWGYIKWKSAVCHSVTASFYLKSIGNAGLWQSPLLSAHGFKKNISSVLILLQKRTWWWLLHNNTPSNSPPSTEFIVPGNLLSVKKKTLTGCEHGLLLHSCWYMYCLLIFLS